MLSVHAVYLHIYVYIRALAAYRASRNWAYPRPGNAEDAEELYQLACSLNRCSAIAGSAAGGEGALVADLSVYRRLITRFAMCSAGSVCPVAAVVGGVVAQEVLKAASGETLAI
jgi:ubiquitin-activating enzyme E1